MAETKQLRLLSAEYEAIYDDLLAAVGRYKNAPSDGLSTFWPMRGRLYDGDLLVVGRTTNGWDEIRSIRDFVDSADRRRAVSRAREMSEGKQPCPMAWLTDPTRYRWNQSAFFRVMKRVATFEGPEPDRETDWASHVCWSNLVKVGRSSMRDSLPGRFQRIQFPFGVKLLAEEIEEFNPHRVLVLTGRSWFEPFANSLGLPIVWRTGLVEGVAVEPSRTWVVAKHPMSKDEGDLVGQVVAAFQGAPSADHESHVLVSEQYRSSGSRGSVLAPGNRRGTGGRGFFRTALGWAGSDGVSGFYVTARLTGYKGREIPGTPIPIAYCSTMTNVLCARGNLSLLAKRAGLLTSYTNDRLSPDTPGQQTERQCLTPSGLAFALCVAHNAPDDIDTSILPTCGRDKPSAERALPRLERFIKETEKAWGPE